MFKLDKPERVLIISLVIIAVSISLFSCQKNRSSKPEDFGSYHLEKEKEFLIHSLALVELLDYYPEDGLYLGYTITPGGNEITLVNEDGEIILSRNMQSEGPEQHPSNLSCLGFSENGDIWAMTNVHVLRYDQNLKPLERFFYTPNFMITLYRLLKKFSYFRKDTNRTEITFPVVPSGVGRYEPGNYNKAKLLEFYDQNQQLSGDLTIPERGIVMTSLPGNRLLIKVVNPDVEEDFTRYAIFRLRIKEY